MPSASKWEKIMFSAWAYMGGRYIAVLIDAGHCNEHPLMTI